MVSERLPNERVVLAEQAAYTIRQSAGQIPEDLERADGNDSESTVDSEQNGFGEDRSHTSGATEPNKSGEDVDE